MQEGRGSTQRFFVTPPEFPFSTDLGTSRKHTLYYRRPEYSEWLPSAAGAAPDLDGLPLLHRETVVERFEEFLADDVTLRVVSHTSGTTGTPLNLYKSYEEIGSSKSIIAD